MLYVFTGNGKGKTTAALGTAMRAVGEGKRVLMVQFIKGPWKSGEDILISKIKEQKAKIQIKDKKLLEGLENFYGFDIVKRGRGFVGIQGDTLPREEHEKAAKDALDYARSEIGSGTWDIVILDEVNNAVALNLISKESVLKLINSLNPLTHLILTGRDAPQEFIDVADLVTEMREVKHPFEKGIKAKRGIEY